MRILHVINSLATGGAERLVSDLLPRLVARGFEVELLVLDARGDVFSSHLEAAGVDVRFARKAGASPYSPFRILDISRAVADFKPDIVHAHLGPSFHWVALVPCKALRIATEHATENRRMAKPQLRFLEKACYRRYAKVACVSPDTAKAIASWVALPSERFPVIANGIPLERFATGVAAAADVESWLAGRFGIAMTARLVRPKAHEVALSALAMLPERYCMVFAGEGPERERLEALALALGVGDRCRFLGSRQDIGAILAACRLYVQTSLVEGFGIASLEAMACGLPVAASDAPGLGDLVRGAGLLFPPGDGEACARAIERIAADPGLASSLVSAGFDRANANSIGRCADAYAGLYKSLASPGEIHP